MTIRHVEKRQPDQFIPLPQGSSIPDTATRDAILFFAFVIVIAIFLLGPSARPTASDFGKTHAEQKLNPSAGTMQPNLYHSLNTRN